MRFRHLFLALVALAPCAVRAEPQLTVSGGFGATSNLFQSPADISASYRQASLGLRGSLEIEEGAITYGITRTLRRVPDFRFADSDETNLAVGFTRKLSPAWGIEIEGAAIRRRAGDLLLALPTGVIGSRQTDIGLQAAVKAIHADGGNKTVLSLRIGTIRKGTAHFTVAALRPVKLDPDLRSLALGAGRYRTVAGGEVCFCLDYRRSEIGRADQVAFSRFPASTLRGSLAYGRRIGDSLTVTVEAGLTALASARLGADSPLIKPYARAEALWALREGTVLGGRFRREVMIDDIDDAIAELTDSYSLSLTQRLHPLAELTLGYEIANSDYVFYVYKRRSDKTNAKLTLGDAAGPRLEIEASHIRRRESDRGANFSGNEIFTRIAGSF